MFLNILKYFNCNFQYEVDIKTRNLAFSFFNDSLLLDNKEIPCS